MVSTTLLGLFQLFRTRFSRQAGNTRNLQAMLHRGEVALAEKSRLLDTILQCMDQGIIIVAADGKVAASNARTATLLDMPESLLARRPSIDEIEAHERLIGFDFVTTPPGPAAPIRNGGLMQVSHLYQRTRPNGRVLEIRTTPTPDGGLVRIYSDITDRKRAEKHTAATRDQPEVARSTGEKASQAKTVFLANLSYEIHRPLHGIIGMNNLLLRSDLSSTQRGYAVGVRESADALSCVIEDILDISKLEAGKLELEHTGFHLGDMIRAACSLLRPCALHKQLDFSCTIHPSAERLVLGDPFRLRQILLNLIGNAVKFTTDGWVEVRTNPDPSDESLLRIEVEDTGLGIAPQTLDRLFQTFAQADSAISRRFGDTGHGLAISRELVALMHGELTAESIPGKGSIFRIILPLPDSPCERKATQVHAERESTDRVLKVLVADDNVINQRLMAALLEGAGHSVTLVVNGRKAVEAVTRGQFDIVLMDLQMPVMDGIQATNHIRALPAPKRDIPIIALATDASRGAAERYRGFGMDAHLSKPVSAPALFMTLNELTADGRPKRVLADNMPALDHAAIEALRGFLKPDQLEALLTESLVDIEARIQRLSICLDLADGANAAKEAHDLVSVAGNCGALKLSVLARGIERACKQARIADAVLGFTRMQDVATDAIGAMTRLRDALAEN